MNSSTSTTSHCPTGSPDPYRKPLLMPLIRMYTPVAHHSRHTIALMQPASKLMKLIAWPTGKQQGPGCCGISRLKRSIPGPDQILPPTLDPSHAGTTADNSTSPPTASTVTLRQVMQLKLPCTLRVSQATVALSHMGTSSPKYPKLLTR